MTAVEWLYSNVRESKMKKSMRKRQCFKCEGKIEKGETYMNHQFRYDYRIITVSFCNNCTQAKEMEKQQIIDACNQIEVIGLDHELAGEKYYNQTFNK